MRTMASLLAILALSLPAAAQTSAGTSASQPRAVSGYHAVAVQNGIDIRLHQGPEGVSVSAASPADRDRIKTVVDKGVLKIWFESDTLGRFGWGSRQLKADVSLPVLDALSASGGSDVVLDGPFTAKALSVQLSGGSDFVGQISADTLAFSASGGSDMKVDGRAAHFVLNASGASDFRGSGFEVDTCTISASGGSDVAIAVNRDLVVQASGRSDVTYSGAGRVRAQSASGGSSVRRARR